MVPQATNDHAFWLRASRKLGGVLLASMLLAACERVPPARSVDGPADASSVGGCHMRVIMTFTDSVGEHPADGVVTDISRAANVALVFVRTAGPGLYVFDANASDPRCDALLARLQGDPHVRSVDIDRRRHVEGEGVTTPAPNRPSDQ
jgi:hypothetical protein